MLLLKNNFHSSTLKSFERIGPHDKIIYNIIIASLLGNASAEKRKDSTRIQFHQSSMNMEYLFSLYKKFQERGYCSDNKPKTTKEIGKNNKIYYSYKFKTFSFSTFNWIHELFYPENNIKRIPQNIKEFLSPQVLAIWIMDNGAIIISTNYYNEEDINLLQQSLLENFGLLTNKDKKGSQLRLYFPKNQIENLLKIVKPFMVESIYYKIKIN